MKIRIALLGLLASITAINSFAQVVEYDDMYFNAKDRVVVTSSKPVSMNYAAMERNEVKTPINPTDSYSARNVNPEYLSQSKISQATTEENTPYFISNYAPTGVNQNIYNNPNAGNNSYNGYGNSFYSPYNMGMNGMYSPYSMGMYGMNPYNSFYPYSGFSPYGMYPGSGWSSMISLGFTFGNAMWGNPYMGMGMGYGCMTCFNNFYGGYGMSPWGYGYPASVIVVNPDNVRPVSYGKRPSRSSDLNNPVYNNNRVTTGNTTPVLDSNGNTRGAGGRTTAGNEPGSYYQRGWRENPATRPSSSSGSAWNNSGTRSSGGSWYNSSSSGSRSGSDSFMNSGSRSSGWSSGNNSGFSSGSGSRSTGSMSGGSSGVRRGRD